VNVKLKLKLQTGLLGTAALLGSAMLLPTQEAIAQTAADVILEEIVVTARKREEILEDTPLSVVAISGDAMRAQGIYNIRDVGEYAANVHLSTSDRMGQSRIFIRGIGGGFPNPIQVFGSGMYIDGHYLAGSLSTYMSTLDIERVEMMRGPQGTLFGKNQTGGSINIVTVKPGPEFESSVTVRVGDFGQEDIRAMINVPISDNVFGRFSIASEESDGYYFNRFLNTDVDTRDSQSFRGALRFTPGENWTIDTTITTEKTRDGMMGATCQTRPSAGYVAELALVGQVYTGPTFADAAPGWGGGAGFVEAGKVGATLAFWDACNTDVAMGDFVQSAEKVQFADADTDAAFVAAVWDSGGAVGGLENLQLRFNGSWRDTNYNWLVDRDKTPGHIDTLGAVGDGLRNPGQNITTRSFEFILDGQVNDRLSFLVGAYAYEETSRSGNGNCWRQFTEAYLPNAAADPDVLCDPSQGGLQFEFLFGNSRLVGLPPGNAFQNVNVYTDSIAAFGHLTYVLNDDWTLDLGARWTEDERAFDIVELENISSCTLQGPLLCGPLMPILNDANLLSGGFFNDRKETFDEITPMVSLTRNLTAGGTLDSGMIYFLISEGFLTGSFNDELNIFVNPLLAPLVAYGPESVTNYEFGFKGTLAGGRVRLSADVFWMDYTDKQEEIEFDNTLGQFGPDATFELTQNAGQVDIYGIELELRASPWDGGFLTVDASYLENKYNEFLSTDPADPLGPLVDRSDRVINDRTPDWTLNVSVGHTFQLASGAQLTPQLGMYAQGGYEWLADSNRIPLLSDPHSYCYQDSYEKFRARVTYQPAAGNWEASLYGTNITDERYYDECDNSRAGVFDYRYGRPDAWGLEFVARWGGN